MSNTPMTKELAERLMGIAADSTWPMPLRLAARSSAAGEPLFAITPASLADADVLAALTENLYWRRDRPAAVDVLPIVFVVAPRNSARAEAVDPCG